MAFKRVFSPTQVQAYETCPKQYHARYIEKRFPFVQNIYAKWGELVHNNIDNYLQGTVPNMHPRLSKLQGVLDSNRSKIIATEIAMGMSADGKPTTQYGNGAWINSKIDMTAADAKRTTIVGVDWKTGKAKEARIQMDMNAMVLAAKYKDTAKQIKMVFPHLFHDRVFTHVYDTKAMQVAGTYGIIYKLQDAIRDNNFPPKPNGLCKQWCPVLDCPHNGSR